jgi:Sulfotransferase domain
VKPPGEGILSLQRPPCWGLGLGRTGTNSFCEALRLLGYDRNRIEHNPPFEHLSALEGGADNGVLLFYKYLDFKFPGSKFVLTLRPLESWLNSMAYASERYPIKARNDDLAIMRRMSLYESVTFDREKFEIAYHRHHMDVRRYFAKRPADLLEMDLIGGDGWETLCPFLRLPVPSAPFPHLHARELLSYGAA